MGHLNRRLRDLRAAAYPPLSMTEMAERLGFDSRQAYHFYERDNGYKQPFLNVDLAQRIAAILRERGVNPDHVMALAGIGEGESLVPDLSEQERQLLDCFADLSAADRTALLRIAMSLSGKLPTPGTTINAPARGYNHQPRGTG